MSECCCEKSRCVKRCGDKVRNTETLDVITLSFAVATILTVFYWNHWSQSLVLCFLHLGFLFNKKVKTKKKKKRNERKENSLPEKYPLLPSDTFMLVKFQDMSRLR